MSVRDAFLLAVTEETRMLEEEASRLNQGHLSKPRFGSDAQQIVHDGQHEAGTVRRRIEGLIHRQPCASLANRYLFESSR
jgi:hypothetical protein